MQCLAMLLKLHSCLSTQCIYIYIYFPSHALPQLTRLVLTLLQLELFCLTRFVFTHMRLTRFVSQIYIDIYIHTFSRLCTRSVIVNARSHIAFEVAQLSLDTTCIYSYFPRCRTFFTLLSLSLMIVTRCPAQRQETDQRQFL